MLSAHVIGADHVQHPPVKLFLDFRSQEIPQRCRPTGPTHGDVASPGLTPFLSCLCQRDAHPVPGQQHHHLRAPHRLPLHHAAGLLRRAGRPSWSRAPGRSTRARARRNWHVRAPRLAARLAILTPPSNGCPSTCRGFDRRSSCGRDDGKRVLAPRAHGLSSASPLAH